MKKMCMLSFGTFFLSKAKLRKVFNNLHFCGFCHICVKLLMNVYDFFLLFYEVCIYLHK